MKDWTSYDDVAEIYERVHAPRLAAPGRDLLTFAGVAAGDRVLDVGTGTGATAETAAGITGPSGTSMGVDMSLGMLRVARRDRPLIPVAAAVALDLPFRNGAFDVAVANFVISHFRD